jgi:uncharacterized protein with FMN-binding domain
MSPRPPSLAKRLLPAVAMTAAASGLVGLLDRPSGGSASNIPDSAAALPGRVGVGAGTVPPPVSSTVPPLAVVPSQSTPVASQPAQPAPVASQPDQPAPAQLPAATTPAAATSGACQGNVVDGPTVDTRWGPVQVEAVVSATGQICNVDAIQSPNSHGRSVRINDFALPILHTEVMDAQTANIDSVSGATITSRAYQRSLQSILDGGG